MVFCWTFNGRHGSEVEVDEVVYEQLCCLEEFI